MSTEFLAKIGDARSEWQALDYCKQRDKLIAAISQIMEESSSQGDIPLTIPQVAAADIVNELLASTPDEFTELVRNVDIFGTFARAGLCAVFDCEEEHANAVNAVMRRDVIEASLLAESEPGNVDSVCELLAKIAIGSEFYDKTFAVANIMASVFAVACGMPPFVLSSCVLKEYAVQLSAERINRGYSPDCWVEEPSVFYKLMDLVADAMVKTVNM